MVCKSLVAFETLPARRKAPKESLGFKKEKKYSREYDDLDDLFGRWSDDEYREIRAKITGERQIDQELWK